MSPSPPGQVHKAVPCPFCGLACDDLEITVDSDSVRPSRNGCARSRALFSAPAGSDARDTAPRIDGRAATLDAAASRIADILRQARLPLIGGMATDVAGARAALELAERTGAVVDHMNGDATLRNLRVLQDSGWMATTLSEVRNRADLLVIAGTDIAPRFPRFFERCLGGDATLFSDAPLKREVVMLGSADARSIAIATESANVRVIPCSALQLAEVFGALRCLLAGRPLQTRSAGGIPLEDLERLLLRMRQSRYGVVAWSTADLDFPHAELAVQSICELVKELNATTRFSVLPLGGSDGDVTANQVCLWQTGFPLRTGFGNGVPDYDPYRHSTRRLLERGEADALVWISAFDGCRTPPECPIPLVVLGPSGMQLSQTPAVYVPVGTPGVDHGGHFFRTDNVVALRLRPLVNRGLPTVAQVLTDVCRRLGPLEAPC